jgi:hypothetical protein
MLSLMNLQYTFLADVSTTTIVVLQTSVQNARYLRGIFDNGEKSDDK